ncbi:hypothetical protein [Hyalangium rubrum]|uniref:Type II secretion system protein GspE N-terminal domain-containing protein n=1 Tax=Hyalangium rubrum TaxID=3103134 RepID=A0ABU5HH45_9BACT|nr:hypothetical protein [Hyalangium sp. s54d21]MDY7232575.1 hypothetical protein [Hyalangium sp. s54d21]
MRLGELLIREKLITPQALEEALESQVVHGGRLGTNLLELGLIAEPDLARMLGKLHGCAHASGEMKPDAQALALVDLNDADNRDYLPMRVDATRLSLAVMNPTDYTMLDSLGFQTGKRVVPVVIPEFRMHQLLRRYCKAFRPLRAIDMNAMQKPKPQPLQKLESLGASGEVSRSSNKSTELISEEEFQSVYAQALTGGARSDSLMQLLEEEEEIITGEVVAEELEEEVITGEVVEEAPPEVYAPPPEAPPARPTMQMWAVPSAPEAYAEAMQAVAQQPVPDYSLPPVEQPVAPYAPPPVAQPEVPQELPFIPAPVEPPARRPTASFIPVPTENAQARPPPAAPALPPVAPVVPPVAPPPQAQGPQAARPAAAPGKVAARRPGVAKPAALKPLTFADAQAQLAKSLDREDVATTVLRFAVGKWRRCLLLSVQGSLVTGWHGMGRGVRDAAVRRIGVALRPQNTFRLVRDTRSHYVGPVRRDTAMNVFYRLLGADKQPEPTYPKTSVILPLLVRGKVVHLLYLDNGPDQLTPPDVGELLILAQSVGRSYEAMIRRRKSA